MAERITIRLDEELQHLILKIKNKGLYNLSALLRQALKDKLSVLSYIDNSSQLIPLEKERDENNETSYI